MPGDPAADGSAAFTHLHPYTLRGSGASPHTAWGRGDGPRFGLRPGSREEMLAARAAEHGELSGAR